MKKVTMLFLLFMLSACVEYPSVDGLDVPVVEVAATEIFKNFTATEEVTVAEEDIPESLKVLNPIEVRVNKYEVIIVLSKNFYSESGVVVIPIYKHVTGTKSSNTRMGEIEKIDGSTFTYKKGWIL